MRREAPVFNGNPAEHAPIAAHLNGISRNGNGKPHDTFAAVFLCGGKGTRMIDVTGGKIPKALFEVGGKPLIRHGIDELSATGMISTFVFAVDHLAEQMSAWIAAAKLPAEVLTLNLPNSSIPFKVHAAAQKVSADHIVIANGDEIRDYFKLREALVQHAVTGAAATAIVTNPYNTVGQSMLFRIGKDGRVADAAKAESLKPGEVDSGDWLKHAGITIMRRDASTRLDVKAPDWDLGINLPLVREKLLQAHVNRDMVFFNVNSRQEITAVTNYLLARNAVSP